MALLVPWGCFGLGVAVLCVVCFVAVFCASGRSR